MKFPICVALTWAVFVSHAPEPCVAISDYNFANILYEVIARKHVNFVFSPIGVEYVILYTNSTERSYAHEEPNNFTLHNKIYAEQIVDRYRSNGIGSRSNSDLLNVVTMKGYWDNLSYEFITVPRYFNIGYYNAVPHDMVETEGDFGYAENYQLGAKILRIPYKDRDASLIIFLPVTLAINEMESILAYADLTGIINQMRMERVYVSLPKFSVDYLVDVVDLLKQFEYPNLMSMRVQQLTSFDIGEKGTGVSSDTRYFWPNYYFGQFVFAAHEPFVFLVEASTGETRNILFYGRIQNP